MVLAVVNGITEVYPTIQKFNEALFSPEKQLTYVTDFSVKGHNYAERKEYVRNLVMDVQSALAGASISWLEIAIIQNKLLRLTKRYGLLNEFKENGAI